jgi:uncharacterized Zn finger protein
VSAFTERELRRLAGPARLTRARSLLGSVSDLYEDELSVCAAVEDGERHLAMIHHAFGPLSAECDCPNGANAPCCDHAAAVGLYYLTDDLR